MNQAQAQVVRVLASRLNLKPHQGPSPQVEFDLWCGEVAPPQACAKHGGFGREIPDPPRARRQDGTVGCGTPMGALQHHLNVSTRRTTPCSTSLPHLSATSGDYSAKDDASATRTAWGNTASQTIDSSASRPASNACACPPKRATEAKTPRT